MIWSLTQHLSANCLAAQELPFEVNVNSLVPPGFQTTVFAAIIFVLRTGIQWKALPKAASGSASAVHKYFLEWKRQKVFVRLWRKALAESDDLEGIAWAWQRIDGAMVKAPLALDAVGPNPTDRGKKGDQTQPPRRREWNPALPHRERRPPA